MQPSQAEHPHLIEDVLRPGLRVVSCGTALGRTSAEAKAYYAHKRNLFWTTLHEVGLTAAGRPLAPSEYSRATEFGIGLTDLCKHAFGNDSELPRGAFDVAVLREKILRCSLRSSPSPARHRAGLFAAVGRNSVGWQQPVGATRVYILPSTSASARWQWQQTKAHWDILASAVRAGKQQRTAGPGAGREL